MRNAFLLFVFCAVFAALFGIRATAQSQTPATARDQQALLARGKYLVNGPLECGSCHTPRDEKGNPLPGMSFAGGNKFSSPVFTAYSRNITPDKDTGIGTWTDEELIRAVREGTTREGDVIGPPMPVMTFNNMSDNDAKAVVVYLRSLTPVHHEVPDSQYKIAPHPFPVAKGLPAPAITDKVAYGGYIVNGLAHCMECHTTPDAHGQPDFTNHRGAGGFPLEVINGKLIHSLNITPDKETGIGAWTDDQIKRSLTEGIDKDGKQLIPLMPYSYFKNMTPTDIDAVVAYLHTVAPVANKVDPNPSLAELGISPPRK